MKYYILILLFIFGISSAQQNEKYQIYIVKITKFKNGTEEQKDIFIDSLGLVKNNLNSATFSINSEKITKAADDLLSNEKFEKFEAGTYKNRSLYKSNLVGENINIYITKLSDLKKETTTNKSFYFYYKFYPYEENKDITYDFDKFLTLPEFEKLLKLLH